MYSMAFSPNICPATNMKTCINRILSFISYFINKQVKTMNDSDIVFVWERKYVIDAGLFQWDGLYESSCGVLWIAE